MSIEFMYYADYPQKGIIKMKKNIVGFSKEDCKFYIDEASRKVVCVASVDPFTLYDFINRITHPIMQEYTEKYFMPTIYKGIATCSANDEWDEEYGKNLAYSRAKKKFLRSFFKRAQTYIKDYEQILDNLVVAFNQYGDASSTRMDQLDKKLER